MRTKRQVLVYGGGAVGSIIGWRVAQNSSSMVSVVCRSNYEAVKRSGYELKTNTWGNGYFAPHRVLQSGTLSKTTFDQPFDYCILANKVKDDYTFALSELRRLVSPQTTLVAAQNGMDVEVPLRSTFPDNTILSAVCNIGCAQVRPGIIEQTASIKRPAFLIGAYGQLNATDVHRRDTLTALDPEFGSVNCVTQERWRKLVLNSAWNSTTALTGLNTHEVLERPGAARLMYQIADEAVCVAAASGVTLDEDLPTQVIDLARDSLPITPSTLQDARRRRPMELAPIFGK
ncbi:Putative 6-phosphogluconate dehydrogenase-like domain superfamily, ketopantoate reductase [Septoria linicola]|uniref:6-phosphogluconate dehydrogenase-like domain superfamily, ketopantoate reductase n=1 Tax=Septoria linicola TaxID=215465 RepID=A0A9Q9AGJ7_9PEZI|nr:Putative 6-phosphogluconate dehydrogenase-like domain superfamily, ketopantoate reductase [Septoria linicola]